MTGNLPSSNISSVALVTGASGGLGRELALALSAAGFTVAINYLTSRDKAEEVRKAAGRKSFLAGGDVSDPVEAAAIVSCIAEREGRLDAVINNAGISLDNLLLRQSEDEWDRVIAVNLKGPFNITKAAVPLLSKSGGGHVVNISSHSGLKGKAGQAAYSASKAALLGLTYASARELAGVNIRVNAVLPGYLTTGMGSNAPAAMKKAIEESVAGRLSSASEAALFISMLIRTENITGQVFNLDSRII